MLKFHIPLRLALIAGAFPIIGFFMNGGPVKTGSDMLEEKDLAIGRRDSTRFSQRRDGIGDRTEHTGGNDRVELSILERQLVRICCSKLDGTSCNGGTLARSTQHSL